MSSSTIAHDPEIKNEANVEEKREEDYEVKFGPDDPEDPHNWSRASRWYITLLGGILGVNATFASSAPSGYVPEMMAYFGFGREVGVLTIALFVAGYAIGPLLWGPLSEQYGRKLPLLVAFTAYTGFTVGCALSRNTGSILVFRFLGGTFAASALVISGALMGDIWDARTRGKAVAIFTLAPFAGPSLGPTVSGFMAVSGVSWRWIYWVMVIFAGACLVLIALTLPETYGPVILVKRAARLRKDTGDERYFAPLDKKKMTFVKTLEVVVARPFAIFIQEPMLIALTILLIFASCSYTDSNHRPIVCTHSDIYALGITDFPFAVDSLYSP